MEQDQQCQHCHLTVVGQCANCWVYKSMFNEKLTYNQMRWRSSISNLITIICAINYLQSNPDYNPQAINYDDHFQRCILRDFKDKNQLRTKGSKFFCFYQNDIEYVPGMSALKSKIKISSKHKIQEPIIKDKIHEDNQTYSQKKNNENEAQTQLGQQINKFQGQKQGQNDQKQKMSQGSQSILEYGSQRSYSILEGPSFIDHVVAIKSPKYSNIVKDYDHYMSLIRNIDNRIKYLRSEKFQHFSSYLDKLESFYEFIKQEFKLMQEVGDEYQKNKIQDFLAHFNQFNNAEVVSQKQKQKEQKEQYDQLDENNQQLKSQNNLEQVQGQNQTLSKQANQTNQQNKGEEDHKVNEENYQIKQDDSPKQNQQNNQKISNVRFNRKNETKIELKFQLQTKNQQTKVQQAKQQSSEEMESQLQQKKQLLINDISEVAIKLLYIFKMTGYKIINQYISSYNPKKISIMRFFLQLFSFQYQKQRKRLQQQNLKAYLTDQKDPKFTLIQRGLLIPIETHKRAKQIYQKGNFLSFNSITSWSNSKNVIKKFSDNQQGQGVIIFKLEDISKKQFLNLQVYIKNVIKQGKYSKKNLNLLKSFQSKASQQTESILASNRIFRVLDCQKLKGGDIYIVTLKLDEDKLLSQKKGKYYFNILNQTHKVTKQQIKNSFKKQNKQQLLAQLRLAKKRLLQQVENIDNLQYLKQGIEPGDLSKVAQNKQTQKIINIFQNYDGQKVQNALKQFLKQSIYKKDTLKTIQQGIIKNFKYYGDDWDELFQIIQREQPQLLSGYDRTPLKSVFE